MNDTTTTTAQATPATPTHKEGVPGGTQATKATPPSGSVKATPATPDTARRPDPAPLPTGDALGKARKEAAGYRERLRNAERERDALAELLGKSRRVMLAGSKPMKRILESGRADFIDLLDDDAVAAVFDGEGGLDETALDAKIDELTGRKPYFLVKAEGRRLHTEDVLARKVAMQAEYPSGTSHPKGDPLRNALGRRR